MKLTFKQGIVKSQVDSNNIPTFLQKNVSSDYISLYINTTSTLINFSHGDVDYLYEETSSVAQAWGPFNTPTDNTYYLYWDIDLDTGIRSFGYTLTPLIVSSESPMILINDQHWFNLADKKMYVYQNLKWYETIRVFAGIYANGILEPYDILDTSVVPAVIKYFGSQVGVNETANAGFILFDDNTLPIRRAQNSTFLTTESHFYTTKSFISSVNFDTTIFYARAIENIPAYSVVAYHKDNTFGIASYDDSQVKSANGFVRNEIYSGEVSNIITSGYISNANWNFNVPSATPVYVGINGKIQTTPPTIGFIQKVGTIVSSDTIFVNIEPQIIYHTDSHISATVPLNIDFLSGKLFTAQSTNSQTKLPIPDPDTPTPEPSASTLLGLTFVQHNVRRIWSMTHSKDTEHAFVQAYDDEGNILNPISIHTQPNTILITFSTPVKGRAQAVLFLTPNYVNMPNNIGPTLTEYVQATPSASWNITHNLGYNPITRVYVDGILILPDSIIHNSIDSIIINFETPQAGLVRFI